MKQPGSRAAFALSEPSLPVAMSNTSGFAVVASEKNVRSTVAKNLPAVLINPKSAAKLNPYGIEENLSSFGRRRRYSCGQ